MKDDEERTVMLAILVAGISVVAICVATAYSCTQSNNAYYESYQYCVVHGGTFIPATNGSACVINGQKSP